MSLNTRQLFVLVLGAVCAVSAELCQQTDAPPSATSECCGLDLADDHRKTSGDAAINQFPWVALIEGEDGRITCTGVLISSRYVLTAASCLFRSPQNVRLGDYNKTHSGPDCLMIGGEKVCNDGATTIPIAHAVSHPRIRHPKTYNSNIAMIKLAQQVPYNEFIRPICLPVSDITESPPDNLHLINAGWGSKPGSYQEEDVVKHYVELPYIPLEKCMQIYASRNKNPDVDENHICAGGEKGLDSCRGDGGGPLMSENGGRYTLEGIVNFGLSPCGTKGIPSVYTKVYPYLPWIQSIVTS